MQIKETIRSIVEPKSTNVFWLDISDADNPTLKHYFNGSWQAISAAGGGSADAITYNEQSLTDPQKAQARSNIGAEASTNKITAISSASTDTEYPSAKAVYTLVNSSSGGGNPTAVLRFTYGEDYITMVSGGYIEVYPGETYYGDISLSPAPSDVESCYIDVRSIGQNDVVYIDTVGDGTPTQRSLSFTVDNGAEDGDFCYHIIFYAYTESGDTKQYSFVLSGHVTVGE